MAEPVSDPYRVPCNEHGAEERGEPGPWSDLTQEFHCIFFVTNPVTGRAVEANRLRLFESRQVEILDASGNSSGRHGNWRCNYNGPDRYIDITSHVTEELLQRRINRFVKSNNHPFIWRTTPETVAQACVLIAIREPLYP